MKRFKKVVALAVFGALVLATLVVYADEPQFVPIYDQIETERPVYDGHETQEATDETRNQPVQLEETPEDNASETHNQADVYGEPVEPQELGDSTNIYETNEAHEQRILEEPASVPNFISFTGDVREISPIFGNDGQPVHNQYYVRMQSREYGTTVFRTDYNTFILGEPIGVGDTVTGWYVSGAPEMLIYPPQHLARVLINDIGDFDNAKIDRFVLDPSRRTLVSEGYDLVLNFTEETPVKMQDGSTFYVPEGSALLNELDGRILVVTHGILDSMVPGGTRPSDPTLSITVLSDLTSQSPQDTDDTQSSTENIGTNGYLGPGWVSNEGISVNENKLEATWQRIGNAYYVPFRAVVDALGFGDTIVWDGDNMIITANNGSKTIAFSVNASNFIVGDQIATLDHPAILEGGTTYVPWQFFRDVFGVNASFTGGHVSVDSYTQTE